MELVTSLDRKSLVKLVKAHEVPLPGHLSPFDSYYKLEVFSDLAFLTPFILSKFEYTTWLYVRPLTFTLMEQDNLELYNFLSMLSERNVFWCLHLPEHAWRLKG